jgi:hypothetical protein
MQSLSNASPISLIRLQDLKKNACRHLNLYLLWKSTFEPTIYRILGEHHYATDAVYTFHMNSLYLLREKGILLLLVQSSLKITYIY